MGELYVPNIGVLLSAITYPAESVTVHTSTDLFNFNNCNFGICLSLTNLTFVENSTYAKIPPLLLSSLFLKFGSPPKAVM